MVSVRLTNGSLAQKKGSGAPLDVPV